MLDSKYQVKDGNSKRTRSSEENRENILKLFERNVSNSMSISNKDKPETINRHLSRSRRSGL